MIRFSQPGELTDRGSIVCACDRCGRHIVLATGCHAEEMPRERALRILAMKHWSVAPRFICSRCNGWDLMPVGDFSRWQLRGAAQELFGRLARMSAMHGSTVVLREKLDEVGFFAEWNKNA